jgi:hypothetical protein
LPPSGHICDFSFAGPGADLTASATINGSAVTASFKPDQFSIAFADRPTFHVQKVPQLSIPKPIKRPPPARSPAPGDPRSFLPNIPSYGLYTGIAILTPLVAWNLLNYIRSLCRDRAAARKGNTPPKAKQE